MLAIAWPAAFLLFLPVFLVEALVACRTLRITWRESFRLSFAANLVSTLIGIPIAWLVALIPAVVISVMASANHSFFQSMPEWVGVVLAPAWIGDGPQWAVPLAGAALCIPFLFASVWIERWIGGTLKLTDSRSIRTWAWRANLWSYSLIVLTLLAIAVHSVLNRA